METIKTFLDKTVVGTLTVGKLALGILIGVVGYIIIKRNTNQ